MTFDYLAFIGRFQPFHLGHKNVVDTALDQAKHVILLIGSPNVARSIRNPFTIEERIEMITAVYRYEVATGRLIIRAIDDTIYNDQAWIADVQRVASETILDHANEGAARLHGLDDFKIGLAGFGKDGTSYYLKRFPNWASVDIKPVYATFNATDIRADYFRSAPLLPRDNCPPEVVEWMSGFRADPAFETLVREAQFVGEYKTQWASAPFPPVFVTVDAVVVQSGHILLVRRGGQPGKGQLALPGGFVDQDETLRASVIRELREETGISDEKGPIPPAMLGSFIEDAETRIFDAPYRSVRGRTITHAFKFMLPERKRLFSVKGMDDAEHAQWHPLGALDPRGFFEDHWFIIQEMVGL